jgi:hypothetical protein
MTESTNELIYEALKAIRGRHSRPRARRQGHESVSRSICRVLTPCHSAQKSLALLTCLLAGNTAMQADSDATGAASSTILDQIAPLTGFKYAHPKAGHFFAPTTGEFKKIG